MKTILILVILLSGCSAQVASWELDKAQEICAPHKGVDYLDVVRPTTVRCRDGVVGVVKGEYLLP